MDVVDLVDCGAEPGALELNVKAAAWAYATRTWAEPRSAWVGQGVNASAAGRSTFAELRRRRGSAPLAPPLDATGLWNLERKLPCGVVCLVLYHGTGGVP